MDCRGESLYVNGHVTGNSPYLTFEWKAGKSGENYEVETQLIGEYNFPNALAAVTIGHFFEVEPQKINKVLQCCHHTCRIGIISIDNQCVPGCFFQLRTIVLRSIFSECFIYFLRFNFKEVSDSNSSQSVREHTDYRCL